MRALFIALTLLLVSMVPGRPALAVEASQALQACPLPQGQAFPQITLEGRLTAEQAASLGLSGTATPVPIEAIRAEVLVVEVFSMYCPFCQKEAPVVNELHELIAARGLADRIKIIGIGAGNSDLEVEVYRKKFGVPFPLFADADFGDHKALGQVGTPYFYVLRRGADGTFSVLEGNLGCMESPQAFLGGILGRLGK